MSSHSSKNGRELVTGPKIICLMLIMIVTGFMVIRYIVQEGHYVVARNEAFIAERDKCLKNNHTVKLCLKKVEQCTKVNNFNDNWENMKRQEISTNSIIMMNCFMELPDKGDFCMSSLDECKNSNVSFIWKVHDFFRNIR